ncbi:MAG: hypothetical protein JNL44_18500, partial [Gemmatimonadetes bacterium]|nr:hypothetical protein [Gemmatimonadota bacterium]
PRAIPGALDQLAAGQRAELRIAVEGGTPEHEQRLVFDPADYTGGALPVLPRPAFLAIVSSSALATTMARKASGRVDGLVVEGATAGGHNAPPRACAVRQACRSARPLRFARNRGCGRR